MRNDSFTDKSGSDQPTAIPLLDQIRVEIPVKIVYDFRKQSQNMQMVRQGKLGNFRGEEKLDEILSEDDLGKIENELKKKHKKRTKREIERANRPQ